MLASMTLEEKLELLQKLQAGEPLSPAWDAGEDPIALPVIEGSVSNGAAPSGSGAAAT